MKKISKFDYYLLSTCCDYYHFALFNAQRYTIKDVENIIKQDLEYNDEKVIFGNEPGNYKINRSFAKWSAGRNEDDEPCVGWCEFHSRRSLKGMIPCYDVRLVCSGDDKSGLEYVEPDFIESDLVLVKDD